MPPTASRPARTLIVLGVLIVALYTVMAATRSFTPRLGLDLRGGTSITLTAKPTAGQGGVTKAKLQEAVGIISARVGGTGISEPDISTQGNDNIVVSVPGVNQDQIVKLVGQTAELRFRQVLYYQDATPPAPKPTGTATPTTKPSTQPSPTATSTKKTSTKKTGAGDRYPAYAAASPSPTTSPTPPQSPSPNPAAKPVEAAIVTQLPSAAKIKELSAFTCAKYNPNTDNPHQDLYTCNREGTVKYLLGPAIIEGTEVSGASAGIPASQVAWQVNLELKGAGVTKFRDATNTLYALQQPLSQFAIVLDGRVVSAPVIQGPIPGGEASITGNFSQQSATDLANVLKYGALPLRFDVSSIDSVSPLLGQDQLDGGLLAGALGLALVIIYCFLYYRGLGIVVTSSLVVAASITFAAVVLLGQAQGLTLTLAGIAGLIVAIGITADSFIVYFERLRDEAREGRSLRTSVESGWIRARRTIFAADSVSLLAAVVLYALSVGSVRNFAYTLGLTTLVDLLVVMMFTKPIMTLLARTKFFGQGHKFSGLDPEHLGIKTAATQPPRRPPGGGRPGRASTDPSDPGPTGPTAIQEG